MPVPAPTPAPVPTATPPPRPPGERVRPRRRRRGIGGRLPVSAAVIGAAALTTAACVAPETPTAGTPRATPTPPTSSNRTSTTTPAPAARSASRQPSAAPTAARECVDAVVSGLSAEERAGQLLMVGLDSSARLSSLDGLVKGRRVGGVVLLGGWYAGRADVRKATRHLAESTRTSSPGVGLLVAADQEGGEVQQLRGPGFTRVPSAHAQAQAGVTRVRQTAGTLARELKAAGVNVNLAPVADTVPASLGRRNAPIGRWDRQFSSDPATTGTMVAAFVAGTEAAGVASTVKHFPGIGRITGNTDLTSTGITDRTTTVADAYLAPFTQGIRAGARLVMVSSAVYSRIDPGTHAVFSKAVVTDLLRRRLGYRGVVITDDVGAAKAVAAVPVGERATRFVAAGGDIVLTARPATVPAMHDALVDRMSKDRAFARQVDAAVERVVALKLGLGLVRCP